MEKLDRYTTYVVMALFVTALTVLFTKVFPWWLAIPLAFLPVTGFEGKHFMTLLSRSVITIIAFWVVPGFMQVSPLTAFDFSTVADVLTSGRIALFVCVLLGFVLTDYVGLNKR